MLLISAGRRRETGEDETNRVMLLASRPSCETQKWRRGPRDRVNSSPTRERSGVLSISVRI